MCSHGALINGATMPRMNETCHLIQCISPSSFFWKESCNKEGHSTISIQQDTQQAFNKQKISCNRNALTSTTLQCFPFNTHTVIQNPPSQMDRKTCLLSGSPSQAIHKDHDIFHKLVMVFFLVSPSALLPQAPL